MLTSAWCSRCVASIDREVPTNKTIVTAASAGSSGKSDTDMANIGMASSTTTVAADFHRPIPAATGRYGRCDGLAPPAHHVCAVPRRLHPHPSCAGLGLASHRHILGNGTGRPTTLHEICVVQTVAAGHVVGVLLSECAE